MADRMFNKETKKVQNQDKSFSVKYFYDAIHHDSCIKPTSFRMNASSSSLKAGLEGEITPAASAYPSSYGNDEIKSVHGDDRLFEITLAKCYVKYLSSLRLPHRVGVSLPSSDVIATFICNGKSHAIKYFGQRKTKKFGVGWRQFVEEHNLVEGDHLRFEVIDNSDGKLVLDVSIIKCSFFK